MKRLNILPIAFLLIFVLFYSCNEVNNTESNSVSNQSDTNHNKEVTLQNKDMGQKPWVINIEKATVNNPHYRNTQWTGEHLQMVLMSLKPGEEIDLEVHQNIDQFIRIEQGEAKVSIGKSEKELSFDKKVTDDWAVFIPAGYYHHFKNIGNVDLKLYSIYTPTEHPAGTLHETYEEAQEHHNEH